MMIMMIFVLCVVKVSTELTVDLKINGDTVLGSNDVQLSCIIKAENNETVRRVDVYSRFDGNDFKDVILFDLIEKFAIIKRPAGNYLEGRVTLTNLLVSENRTLVEYSMITCEDNTAYRCDVEYRNDFFDVFTVQSPERSMEVKGSPSKPDGIPIRTSDLKVCPGMNVDFSCTGNVGVPPGYFRWTKFNNGSATIYNDTEMQGTCFNRTSILSIEVQKEDNNAFFRCEVIHELATSDMYQQTIPQVFVYDPYEYTVITKEPDKNYYDPTTPFIELTCFAQGCNLPNYTWYKDTDLNTTIGNDSLYRINNVEKGNSGNYICVVETFINGTEEKYNQTVTIDIRFLDQPEQLPTDEGGFADTAAGLATITAVSVGGTVLTSIVLFKIITKVTHLRMQKTVGVKKCHLSIRIRREVGYISMRQQPETNNQSTRRVVNNKQDVETVVNNEEPDKEATQGIDDEGLVSEVSQQWQNNAPIQSTM